jgi:hypothetical protein
VNPQQLFLVFILEIKQNENRGIIGFEVRNGEGLLDDIYALGEPKPVLIFIFVFVRIEVDRLAGGTDSGRLDIALVYCVSFCLISMFLHIWIPGCSLCTISTF